MLLQTNRAIGLLKTHFLSLFSPGQWEVLELDRVLQSFKPTNYELPNDV